MKLAENGNIGTVEATDPKLGCNERQLLEKLNGGSFSVFGYFLEFSILGNCKEIDGVSSENLSSNGNY